MEKHAITFLQDLAVVMIVAGLVTVIFHHLKQPVVLGYILAGLIIGPHTPPFPLIQNEQSIKTLADLGIIFLLFSLGLDFNLRKLKQVGVAALVAGFVEIPLMFWLGYEIGQWFGWKTMDSVFLGAMIAISSTTIIVKALRDLGRTKEESAHLVFGILIVEDIAVIVMIAVFSSVGMSGEMGLLKIGTTAGRLLIFMVTAIVVGLIAVPRLLHFVARFKSDEVLLISVLGLVFGFSLVAVQMGYNVALGAFIIGAVISEARHAAKITLLTEPIRDMFSAVFFVSIGLLLDPRMIVDHALAVAVITVAVILGKVFACSFGTFVAGHDTRTALRVGMSLAQIGEFSFILAALGMSLKLTSDFLYPIAVAVSVITTALTPYRLRSSDRFVAWFHEIAPKGLVEATDLYTRRLSKVGERHSGMAAKLARKWLLQMALNIILIAAIFIGAALAERTRPEWFSWLPFTREQMTTVLWFAAVLLSLPLFIATFRKLQALGMLVAETRGAKPNSREMAVIANGMPLGGITMVALWMMALSATLLPPTNILIVLLAVIVLVTLLSWRFFVRIYSRAQVALRETLAEVPVEKLTPESTHRPTILRDADLHTLLIGPKSIAAGKLIRELQLRTKTGASIVGIDRNGKSIINPGPDEELHANDHILLLGSVEQLETAKALLRGNEKASSR
jgi:CPA2 family monovalent cation:H+ antiporter-2